MFQTFIQSASWRTKLSIQNYRRGFTMIELMVTIGIFALITGAVLANFRSGERGEVLRLAGEQLAQDIRGAQGMVLSGKVTTYKENGDTEAKEQFPQGGYGIGFTTHDAGRYTLFPPASFTSLPKGVIVQRLELSGLASDFLSITLRPPQATAIFQTAEDGLPSLAEVAVITLRHTATNQERRVTINRISGKVSVE